MRHILCRAVCAEWIIVKERDTTVSQNAELTKRLGRRIKYRSKRYAIRVELDDVCAGVIAVGEQLDIGALNIRSKNPDILRLAIGNLELLVRLENASSVINL